MKQAVTLVAFLFLASAATWAADLYVPAPYATVQAAINAANPGDVIHVAAGVYSQDLTINKRVSIVGAGSAAPGGTILRQGTLGPVITLAASGEPGAPILLQDLRVEAVHCAGIAVPDASGTVAHVTLDNVSVIGTNETNDTENEMGLMVRPVASLQYLTITDSAFDHLTYGWYFFKQVSSDTSVVRYVSVTNTSFSYNDAKAIYAEKLSDATFERCTVYGNGVNTAFFNRAWNGGFDFNLKAGTYQNLALNCLLCANNGLGVQHGAGLMIKARNDGSYATYPAQLNNVTITGGTVTGNERGIRIGEPNKNNATPRGVTITGLNLYGNVKTYSGSDGSPYGDLIDMRLTSPADPLNAANNWWGQAGGPVAGQIYNANAPAPTTSPALAAAATGCTPSVTLTPDQTCYQINDDVFVDIVLSDANTEIVGGQWWIQYDATRLAYTPGIGNPAGVAPWSVLLYQSHTAPVIFLSTGIPNDAHGAYAGSMARLKFKALAEVCGTAELVKFKSPDGSPPTRLTDRYDNAIYPNKVNLAAITIDNTPPTITCTNVTMNNDPGQCGATFVEKFDDPVTTCATQTPFCWYVDRYPPAGFAQDVLAGENVLKLSISSADSFGNRPAPYQSSFYNTQGRKYDVQLPVPALITGSLYIPSAWATDARRSDLWATVVTSGGDVSGYPIAGFIANDPADPFNSDPAPGNVVPRFRVWMDEGAGGWIELGLPAGFAYDRWYTFTVDIQSDRYVYTITGGSSPLTYTYPKTDEVVRITDIMVQAYNFGDATHPVGDSYDAYWDNVTIGPRGPVVTDCDVATISGVRSDALPLTAPYPAGCAGHDGVTTITWTATDCSGNSASCVQTITVLDIEPPVITCPTNITIECTESTLPAHTGQASATDHCDPDPAITYADSEAAGACPQEKTITRTWRATDYCDNFSECVQTITVRDRTAPAITCPANITVGCTDSTLPAHTGQATAVDNCDPAPIITYADVPTGGTCPQEWTIARTWRATDHCGNASECTQTITVDDSTPPTIACPPGVTTNADAGTCGAVLATLFDLETINPPNYDYYAFPGCTAERSSALAFGGTWAAHLGLQVSGDYARVRAPITGLPDLTVGNVSAMFQAYVVPGSTANLGPYVMLDVDANGNGVWDGDGPGLDTIIIAFVTGGVPYTQGCWYTDGLNGATTVHVSGDRTGLGPTEFSSSAGGGLMSALRTHVFAGATTWGDLRVLNVRIGAGLWPGSGYFECYADDIVVAKRLEVPPAAQDNCSAPVVTATRSDALSLAAPFPVGGTTITWRATDCCGNHRDGAQTVNVTAFSELLVNLQLRGVTTNTFDRCVTFEFDGPNYAKQAVTFAGGRADNVVVLVPCHATPYTCIRARDELHSLWAVDSDDFGIVGTQYVADFTNDPGHDDDRLVLGNLNRDDWIDVLDFGIYVVRFGQTFPQDLTCSYAASYKHPDFNGDTLTDSLDFSVIQTHFLLGDEAGCATLVLNGTGGPVTRIAVADLAELGLPELAGADLNGDGWLDEYDIVAFANGALPRPPKPLPRPHAGGLEAQEVEAAPANAEFTTPRAAPPVTVQPARSPKGNPAVEGAQQRP